MKNPVKFSIILAAFNAEKTITKAIESVTSQLKDNYELIIIDDASTDQTFTVVSNLAKHNEHIQLYKNNVNSGPSASRNFGLDLAKGNFICFLDADDFYSEGLFEKLKYEIKNKNPDAIKFSIKEIYKNSVRELGQSYFFSNKSAAIAERAINLEALPLFGYVTNCAYKAEVLNSKNIRFDNSLKFAEDFFFNYHLFRSLKSASFLDFYGYNYSKSCGLSLSEKRVPNYFDLYEYKINLLVKWAKEEDCFKKCQNTIAKLILKTIYSSTVRNIRELNIRKTNIEIKKIILNSEIKTIFKDLTFNNKKLNLAKFPLSVGSPLLVIFLSSILLIIISIRPEITKKI